MRNLLSSSFSRILVSLLDNWTSVSRILTPLALDIERFYGQRKLLAQRVPILQPSPLANGSVNVEPSLGQARARAFSDPPSTPSTTGALTPFDSETETDTELDSQQTYYSEGTGVTRLSHHDLRNRYFRRDTIALFNFDIFRFAFLTCARDSMIIIHSSLKQDSRFYAAPRNGIPVIDYSPPNASARERGVAFWACACLDTLPHTRPRPRFARTEHTQVPRDALPKALSLPVRGPPPWCGKRGIR